ncbi:MAG: choice-of-anchor D domain-containing protein, partial [Myxococcaceae bacterium]|nr:choice-of-anchor D domain-containing protein [Myxococcaceae bacterium]
MRTPLLCAALISVAACRCEPPQTVSGVGEIGVVSTIEGVEVTRPNSGTYDFFGVAMGLTRPLDIQIRNTGTGGLQLDTLEPVSGDTQVFNVEFQPQEVSPGSTARIRATFTAPTSDDVQKPFSAMFKLTAGNTAEGAGTADIELKGIAVKTSCVLPDTLDFGGVGVGSTETRTIRIENLTSQADTATLGPITSSNGDHNAIKYGPGWNAGPISLSPGANREVSFRFTPTQTASYSVLVRVKVSEACPESTVRLIGAGVASAVTCDPLDFAFLPVGLTRSQTTTLTNYSLQDVTVSGLAPTTNDYVAGAASVTVPKAQRVMTPQGLQLQPGTAMLNVDFTPTRLGALTGAIAGTTTLPNQPNAGCAVTGNGGGPDIALKPSGTLDLGAIPYFAPPDAPFFASRKLTIQNLGSAPNPPDLRANLKLGVNGAPPMYWKVTPISADATADQICVGAYDAANPNPALRCANGPGNVYDPATGLPATGTQGLLDVPVRVTPSGPNKQLEWEVEIYSNDPDEPMVKLTVRARSVPMQPCDFQVVPSTLQFGLLAPPNQRDLTFEIRNTGLNVCLLTHLELAPMTDATYTLPDGEVDQQMIAVGGSLPVKVRATASGQATSALRQALGAVRFGISSPAVPQTDVSLAASIGLPCLTIAPSELDFGTVKQNCDSSRRVFSVYNTCATPVTVHGWAVTAGAAEFLIDTPPAIAMGGTIPPGAAMPLTFALKYHPLNLGRDTG